ncbi:MAG: site-specific DNA-methyltransferase [bacterium]|nr:site-specific DNA-methyltransferase [bacterium]
MPEKLKMHSPDQVASNVERIAELFPNCVTEAADEDGNLERKIDIDLLRQELSGEIVEGPLERYHLNWPGKREAMLAANAPIAKTLRPCREESVDFDTTQNLFIEGDNLEALKLLQETYLGKVKMIYIDPPYNTGHDFVYNDDFTETTHSHLLRSNQTSDDGMQLLANSNSNGRFHSDWASMIFPRLKLAKTLLAEDGVIFISIDDNEQANAKRIGDEIFGEDNFVTSFVWEKRTTRENRKAFSVNHDFLLCFARCRPKFEETRNLLPLTEEARKRYSNPDDDPRGVWQSVSINAQAGPGRRKEQFYSITTPGGRVVEPPAGRCWIYTKVRLDELVANDQIWFGEDGNNVPRQKVFFDSATQGLTPHTLWSADEIGTTDSAKKDLTKLFDDVTVFDTPKPVGLLSRIIDIATNDGDVVLDFFAGSGPLAEAVFLKAQSSEETRRFILVQLAESVNESLPQLEQLRAMDLHTVADICKERIRRVASKAGTRHELIGRELDLGFRVLKIDSSNMKDVYYSPADTKQEMIGELVDNIKPDRTGEDLLFQVLLDCGVDIGLPIRTERIDKREVFFVNDSEHASPDLIACFDADVPETLVKTIASRTPLRAVFRDHCFTADDAKINVEQIFKQMSPQTQLKSL